MKSPINLLILLLTLLTLSSLTLALDKCNKCPTPGVEHCNHGNGDLMTCQDGCWKTKWSCPKNQQCLMKPGPTCINNGDVCNICHDQYNSCRAVCRFLDVESLLRDQSVLMSLWR
jgi:hypothetical protein